MVTVDIINNERHRLVLESYFPAFGKDSSARIPVLDVVRRLFLLLILVLERQEYYQYWSLLISKL